MQWHGELAYYVTPKRGPLRAARTLSDAKRAIVDDLPKGFAKRPHWLAAGWAVLTAAETGSRHDLRVATDLLAAAIAAEGWMERRPLRSSRDPRLLACLREITDRLDRDRQRVTAWAA
jgi:hypothetical protein